MKHSDDNDPSRYLSEYRLPMLVYVQDEENTKHYATIKKNYMIRGWPSNKDETLPEFVARAHPLGGLREDLPSLKDALREINIAEGEFAHTSLWTLWRKLPGYMDKAGIAYLPEQEEAIAYFQDTFLRTGLPCIVSGFPEDPIVYDNNLLFRIGARDCLTPQDAVYYVTARTISFEDSLAVILVHCPGKLGHGISLQEIIETYSVPQQIAVGRLTPEESEDQRDLHVVDEIKYYLNQIGNEQTQTERVEVATLLMKSLLKKEVVWFIRKYATFRQAVLDKCEELMRDHGAEYPALEAVCEEVLGVLGNFSDASFPFCGPPLVSATATATESVSTPASEEEVSS